MLGIHKRQQFRKFHLTAYRKKLLVALREVTTTSVILHNRNYNASIPGRQGTFLM